MRPTINVIIDFFGFKSWESDWIKFLLSGFTLNVRFDPGHSLVLPHSVLVISLAGQAKAAKITEQLRGYRRAGHSVGLVHLSDERERASTGFYRDAEFVFRNYYRAALAERQNCRFFALGYRSGFNGHLIRKAVEERRYRWSFAGQLKTSRFTMLSAATQIPGGRYHLTQRFADPQGLAPISYAELLSDSKFVLCPRGNHSLECFRVYEAMEAGAIPIVEDPAFDDDAQVLADSQKSYWFHALGPSFPCPRIGSWNKLRQCIESIPLTTANVVTTWWQDYKAKLRSQFTRAIGECFRST
jgi:hypothetical protein